MDYTENLNNDVNGTGTLCEGPPSGRCPVGEQRRPGRHSATARLNWTKEINKLVMECFYLSKPFDDNGKPVRGYRQRMYRIWKEKCPFETTEQRLCDQARSIRKNGWLSDIELEEIQRKLLEPKNDDVDDLNINPLEAEREIVPLEELPENSQAAIDNTMMENEEPPNFQVFEFEGELEEEVAILRTRILQVMMEKPQVRLQSLKSCSRSKVNAIIEKVNYAIGSIRTKNISETNDLMYAAAYVVSEKLGKIKKIKNTSRKEPFWKRRIQTNIDQWRKDLSKVDEVLRGNMKLKSKDSLRFERKYKMSENGTKYTVEMLKQKIKSASTKIKRFEDRNTQYHQNVLFSSNQKRFYEELEGPKHVTNQKAKAEESTKFWSDIWSIAVSHNGNAEWLKDVEKELEAVEKQGDINIMPNDIKTYVRKMANWKAPGPDNIQGFWFKNLTAVHTRLAAHLQECLNSGEIPEWLVKGKTTLIMKDPTKGNDVGNYRPIACLPLMWKLLTGIISEKLYLHLTSNNLLGDEQKGCRKNSRGTKDQLIIDKAILKNCRRRLTNLSMAWIDYRKAYDMVPHSWILKCLEMSGTANNIQALIRNSMPKWKTVLSSEGEALGEVSINRGIFQGDSLSPLLFVIIMIPLSIILRKIKAGYKMNKNSDMINHLLFMDDLKLYASNKNQLHTLVNTVKLFSEDIKMSFGLSKCATLELKRGRKADSTGIDLEGEKIQEADPNGYKYLGILQLDQNLNQKIKERITSEYKSRIKKLCKSKLNGGNLVQGINSWAIGIIRYGGGIVDWNKEELSKLDIMTRKIMSQNRALHIRSNVARLYMPRKEGGRGLISVEECINEEKRSLFSYLNDSHEWMLKEALREGVLREYESKNDYKRSTYEQKKQDWKGKPLHGRFFEEVKDIADPESWRWLRNGFLKKETEGMVLAAQEQALRTNSIKCKIDKTIHSDNCRLCGKPSESVRHLTSGCTKLAQSSYKQRHDKVAIKVHWELCKKYRIECSDKWYNHKPLATTENEEVKIMWDMTVFTDRHLPHNRPDITVVDKQKKCWTLIDIAVPADQNVATTELWKIEKYQDLAFEIERIHKVSVKIVPVVVGCLGTISKNFMRYHQSLGVPKITGSVQIAALLESMHILRKILRL